jgi:hypothetical protein
MTKATDLPALFARLLKIRDSASPASDPALAEVEGTEASVSGLKMIFYTAPRFTAQGALECRVSHVQVYEDGRSVFLASWVIGRPGDVRASKWKRGPWEQLISNAVSVGSDDDSRRRAARVAEEAEHQPAGLTDFERVHQRRTVELVMRRHDPSFESRVN